MRRRAVWTFVVSLVLVGSVLAIGFVGSVSGTDSSVGAAGSSADSAGSIVDYTDDDGVVDTQGLRDAVTDWRSGEIDVDLLRDVIDAWRSGDPVVESDAISVDVADVNEGGAETYSIDVTFDQVGSTSADGPAEYVYLNTTGVDLSDVWSNAVTLDGTDRTVEETYGLAGFDPDGVRLVLDEPLDDVDDGETVTIGLENVNTSGEAGTQTLSVGLAEETGMISDEPWYTAGSDDYEIVSPGVENVDLDTSYHTVQEAVDDAEDGNTIELATATYDEDVTVDVDGLTLRAASDATPTIDPAETGVLVEADDVTLEGLAFDVDDGETDSADGVNVTADATGATIVDNHFDLEEVDNNQVRGVYVDGEAATVEENAFDGSTGTTGVRIIGADDARIEGNAFDGLSDGLVAGQHSSFHASDNEFSVWRHAVWHRSGTGTVVDNSVDEANNGILLGSQATVTVRGNEITDVRYDGIQIRGSNVDAELTDNTITGSERAGMSVRHGGASLEDVRLNWNEFEDNDEGVDATDGDGELDARYNWWGDADGPSGEGDGDGDSVSENVAYDPWLDADGEPDGAPVLNVDQDTTADTIQNGVDAASTGDTLELADGTYDEDVTVDVPGLTIRGTGGATIAPTETGVLVDAEDVTVDGLAFDVDTAETDEARGVDLAANGATVVDNHIDTALVDGGDVYGTYVRADDATIDANTFDGTGMQETSLHIGTGDGTVIENNEFTSGSNAIHTVGDTRIEGNEFTVSSTAVRANTGSVEILNNSIEDATTGVYLAGTSFEATISGNDVDPDSAVDSYGIHISTNEPDATITDNNLTDGDYGIYVDSFTGTPQLDDVEANWNNIVGNDVGVDATGGDGELDATQNWWGDADGPSGEGDGDGDPVTENVAYTGWLNDEAPDGIPIYPVEPTDSSDD